MSPAEVSRLERRAMEVEREVLEFIITGPEAVVGADGMISAIDYTGQRTEWWKQKVEGRVLGRLRGGDLVPRGELGAQAELGGFEGVGLGHGILGAVEAVEDELAEETEADLAGNVEVALASVVDEVDVVAGFVAGDVEVFAEFDVALGAEDDGAAIAPGAEAGRRQPVHVVIAQHDPTVGRRVPQRHPTEVLEAGVRRRRDVGDRRCQHLGRARSCDREELVGLVGGEVDEDASRAIAVEEPLRPAVGGEGVRSGTSHGHELTDRTGVNEADRLGDRPVAEALGEEHPPSTTGRPHRVVDGIELVRRRDGRLGGEHVASGDKGVGGEVASFGGNVGEHHQVERVVAQHAVHRPPLGVGPPSFVHRRQRAVGSGVADRRGTGVHQPVDHLEDVEMLDADHTDAERYVGHGGQATQPRRRRAEDAPPGGRARTSWPVSVVAHDATTQDLDGRAAGGGAVRHRVQLRE